MKKIELYLEKYNNEFLKCIFIDKKVRSKLKNLNEILLKVKKNNKKVIIAGNGGSAAIASHFSVDMTKNGKIKTINFNESDLITCFANDYGYENWLKNALKFYLDEKDLVILISSSGNSKNMINAANFVKNKNNELITFTGFNGKNKLSKIGKLNFTVNSKSYNFIENTHQYWLLSLVDFAAKFKN